MTTALLLLLFLCAFTSGLTALTRRRFEEMLPLTFFMVILVLYAFGWVGLLPYGVGALLLLAVGGAVLAVLCACRDRAAMRARVLTPGLAAFALCYAGVWVVNTGYRIIEWDDFTHWALVVKNMFAYDDFGIGPAATTLFKEYPPALSLLHYFALRLHGAFDEAVMNRLYMLFHLSLLLPVTTCLTGRRKRTLPLLLLICLILPLAYSSQTYRAWYAEQAMGLTMAYMLFAFFTAPRGRVTWLSLALAAAVLALTKGAGVGIAVLTLLALLPALLMRAREDGAPRAARGRDLLGWALALGAALLAWGSWGLLTQRMGIVPTTNAGKVSLAGLWEIAALRAPEYRYDIIGNFFRSMTHPQYGGGLFIYSFVLAFVFLGLLGGWWATLCEGDAKRAALRTTWALLGACAAYALSLLVLYLFTFSEGEGLALASMPRYMGAVFTALMAFFVCMVLHSAHAKPGHAPGTRAAVLCLAALLVLVDINPLITQLFLFPYRARTVHADSAPFDRMTEAVRPFLRGTQEDRVYVLTQHSASGYTFLRAQYALTPTRANGDDPWSIGAPTSERDEWYTLPLTPQDWAQTLATGGYTLVYLFDIDEDFVRAYGELFEDAAGIADGQLYGVQTQGTDVTLTLLN